MHIVGGAVLKVMESPIRFDLELLRICSWAPSALAHHAHRFWTRPGFAGVDLTLPAARRLAATIRAAGGAALIVPSLYRAPIVPILAARRLAEHRLEVLRIRRGGSFGPLEDGEAHAMWWRFYTEHQAPLADEPELVAIDVDVVDGHIATLADERQLAAWQDDIPSSWQARPDGLGVCSAGLAGRMGG